MEMRVGGRLAVTFETVVGTAGIDLDDGPVGIVMMVGKKKKRNSKCNLNC